MGGNPGDTWNGVDISDLTAHYPPNIFRKFPTWLKTKIFEAKRKQDNNRNVNQVEVVNDMRSVISELRTEVASLRDGQARGFMAANTDSQLAEDFPSAASAFGRSSTSDTQFSGRKRKGGKQD